MEKKCCKCVKAAHQQLEAAEAAKVDKLAQAEAAKLQYDIQYQDRLAQAAAKKAAHCKAQLAAAEQYKKIKTEAAAHRLAAQQAQEAKKAALAAE
ncbi:hypothetical protein AJ80_09828 [Polytolypa hystricis UAMH7299]|uniref:Uncharacterized protein n=1 Tax=Polytolypa hystricis (strain UAMH7299) TaxID=1447883 RepID=A0A2B7WIL2_POLH7|nr:hypothetical protein AJ80_09828 [Polytolypa hystricis UAMH7299]